jgi:hypothetical protein
MNKDFPQTEEQQKIYNFWSARGFGKATAVLGNLNVSLHHDNPKYENLGISYIYLEQFYHQAQLDVIDMMQKIIDSEKRRCREANAVTCWVELKNQIKKNSEINNAWSEIKKERQL